jgi:hypothetical protein
MLDPIILWNSIILVKIMLMIRIKFLLLILFLFSSFSSQAQVCAPFDALEEREGVTLSRLESEYAGKDLGKGKELEERVSFPQRTGKAYRTFIKELGQYLADQEGVDWDSTVRYYQRIYFEPDGAASYYLYTFRRNGFEKEERERFEASIENYLAENKLDVDLEDRFAICAPVVLRPPEEDEDE